MCRQARKHRRLARKKNAKDAADKQFVLHNAAKMPASLPTLWKLCITWLILLQDARKQCMDCFQSLFKQDNAKASTQLQLLQRKLAVKAERTLSASRLVLHRFLGKLRQVHPVPEPPTVVSPLVQQKTRVFIKRTRVRLGVAKHSAPFQFPKLQQVQQVQQSQQSQQVQQSQQQQDQEHEQQHEQEQDNSSQNHPPVGHGQGMAEGPRGREVRIVRQPQVGPAVRRDVQVVRQILLKFKSHRVRRAWNNAELAARTRRLRQETSRLQ
uniref:Uncharacterized protein n=1 Tax=Pinguiococcus pyrenoidosus TaxID=172671 RepID=A0A7R9YFL5_9STRA|mmetsp:Transcript_7602/g.28673  ORF Transcript_7602/g.28673 Transcript_7602/m.28673 type:complete len:267 (+) Transcript_7602:397-1197(+)